MLRQSLKVCFVCVGMVVAIPALSQEAWLVGHSAPMSGSNAEFGRDIRDGALAYFNSLNAKGGVGGRRVELVTLDDKNDRKIAGANTQKLLEENKVHALFGYASATLSLDAMPLAEKAGVLFFAPFSGANPVRKQSPTLFTLRASYGDEMDKMIAFWSGFGMKQLVVVHYDDEVGKQNLDAVTASLAKQNAKPLAFPLKRNAKVEPAQVAALIELKPDYIINTVLSGAAADIVKQMQARGAFIPMSSLSFVGAQQFINAAGPAAAGVSIGQVVPNPLAPLPVVRECAKALQDGGITAPMNSTHLEACIGAKVLAEAMRRARKSDARSLLEAMQNLGTWTTTRAASRSPTGRLRTMEASLWNWVWFRATGACATSAACGVAASRPHR